MKKNLITALMCTFAFALGIGINNIAMSDMDSAKIAYVDVNKLISGSNIITNAQKTRENQTKEMLKWYDKASADIQKQQTPDGRQALVKKYEAQLTQKKTAIKDAYSKEIKKADTQMENAISQKAKELGYSLVFRKESLLFGGNDITSQVLPLIK